LFEIEKKENRGYCNNTTDWMIGLLTRSVNASTVGGNSLTNTVDYMYNNTNGLLQTQTVEPNQTAYKSVTAYTYDTFGNVLAKTVTVGNASRSESYTYENGRFVKTHKDVLGQVTTSVYDPVSGLLSSKTDINGDVTSYTYDGFGKIKTMSQSSAPDNSISTSWTWSNGSPANSMVLRTETTGDGQVVKTWYDALGREIQTSHKNFSGKEVYTTTSYRATAPNPAVTIFYFYGEKNPFLSRIILS